MGTPALVELSVKNYKSLRDVSVRLGRLNVLVGPNASGKSNLLDVLQFLGDAVREDLGPALKKRGGALGLHKLYFRGKTSGALEVHVKMGDTSESRGRGSDEYTLQLGSSLSTGGSTSHRLADRLADLLRRSEHFTFERTRGASLRISVSGTKAIVRRTGKQEKKSEVALHRRTLGLSTLPKLSPEQGGKEVGRLSELFSKLRIFDVNVQAVRQSLHDRVDPQVAPRLEPDASNLAHVMYNLSKDEESFERLQEDARAIVPGLKGLHAYLVEELSIVSLELEEAHLKGRTLLSEASFGTIRALALLAMLYDPDPPPITCVEEIDHGLHPYALDIIVDRLRWASQRTQFLITTHSPALVNRLRADELIVCERDPETGESRIPAVDPEKVRAMEERAKGKLGLGELWFTGSLGGVPR